MRKNLLSIVLFSFYLITQSGCGVAEVPGMVLGGKQKQKTQLEIREMQTRTYETNDATMVVKAMLDVLQDDDYIIEQVNIDLGFFNASKEANAEDALEKAWDTFWWGGMATYKKNSIIDCTTNVSQHGETVKVRANFRIKFMNNRGGVEYVGQIDDPTFYQDFFAKVDKGIFIEKEQL
ncbi:MAG TPA: hypothetical protein HPP87_03280 [Planctomycetes bacterium]|nr:hypothetical protein [Planctomycetota bacterium]